MACDRKYLARLLLAWLVLTASGAVGGGILPHVLYGKRIAGHVIDASNGRPVANAHVAFVWESVVNPSGFTGHSSRTICYHAAAGITDDAGHFEVAPWRDWSTYDVDVLDPIALVYAPGYTPREILLHPGPAAPPIDRPIERYELKPFTGTVDERMDALWGGIANRGCMYGGESQKSLYPMLKAIYGEVRQIAVALPHHQRLRSFAVQAGYAALAFDPNGPGHDAELNKFIRENLK